MDDGFMTTTEPRDMNLYSIEVRIYATAYVRAESGADALAIVQEMKHETLQLPDGEHGDVIICGRHFNDPDLPDVSLSPAMTIAGPDEGAEPDLIDDEEEEEVSEG